MFKNINEGRNSLLAAGLQESYFNHKNDIEYLIESSVPQCNGFYHYDQRYLTCMDKLVSEFFSYIAWLIESRNAYFFLFTSIISFFKSIIILLVSQIIARQTGISERNIDLFQRRFFMIFYDEEDESDNEFFVGIHDSDDDEDAFDDGYDTNLDESDVEYEDNERF